MYDELTKVDIEKMEAELRHRITELRPELIRDVQTAREFGDLSENDEYKVAKREKNRNESRIRYLERMIRTARVVEAGGGEGIGLFDKVALYLIDDDETEHVPHHEKFSRGQGHLGPPRRRPGNGQGQRQLQL